MCPLHNSSIPAGCYDVTWCNMKTGQCVVCKRKRGGYDGGMYVYNDVRKLVYVCGVCCETLSRCEWCGERDLIMETVDVHGRDWVICNRCSGHADKPAFVRVAIVNEQNIVPYMDNETDNVVDVLRDWDTTIETLQQRELYVYVDVTLYMPPAGNVTYKLIELLYWDWNAVASLDAVALVGMDGYMYVYFEMFM